MESLFVFLGVHAAGHQFERPEWSENVRLAAAGVGDWSRVWSIARATRVTGVIRRSMSDQPAGSRVILLDGLVGFVIWWTAWLGRGQFLPASLRDTIRGSLDNARQGFGLFPGKSKEEVDFAGLSVAVPRGVFSPKRVTERLLTTGLNLVSGSPTPIVVEVGTGSGAVALAFGKQRPDAWVVATEISSRAVTAARSNRDALCLTNVRVLKGDLLAPLPRSLKGRVDLLLINLPYVPGELARRVGDWGAPLSTIEGPDPDGLGLFRRLIEEAKHFLRPGGFIAFQMIQWQWEGFTLELEANGFRSLGKEDLPLGHATIGSARYVGVVR
jgi:release factor glutamine methyltransferase